MLNLMGTDRNDPTRMRNIADVPPPVPMPLGHSRPESLKSRSWPILVSLVLAVAAATHAGQLPAGETQDPTADQQDDPQRRVSDNALPTGRLLSPVGQSLAFHGRPVDLVVDPRPERQRLLVKDRAGLRVINYANMELVQTLPSPGGASLLGLAVGASGKVYFTNAGDALHIYNADPENPDQLKLERSIKLPADSYPCGLAISKDESLACVCLSKANALALVSLAAPDPDAPDPETAAESPVSSERVETIPVGVAPCDVLWDESESIAWVSNLGGARPEDDQPTAPSAGTPTRVDSRGISAAGSVSRVDLTNRAVTHELAVELQPSSLAWADASAAVSGSADSILVCNSNADRLTWIDTRQLTTREIEVKPDASLPFGSMPADVLALQLPADSGSSATSQQPVWLAALAGNNAIAMLGDLEPRPQLRGLIPTGWYPVAMAASEQYLFVANVKGNGGRAERRPAAEGRNSHDHLGTVQRIDLAQLAQPELLGEWTQTVRRNGRVPQMLRSLELTQQGPSPQTETVEPTPVPQRLGDPSVFQHVIYVIKENRTFDQVFGDVPAANSEPELCIFPERITPNHHALADRFGLLDNYYCNGVLSADGHSWATEGNVTPYLERAFGGFARSYTFGDDPLTYSRTGFIWDHVLGAGLSFRNYGEFDYAEPPEGMKYQEIWQAHVDGTELEFSQKIGIQRLREYSCRDYPGWNMVIPDVLRMDRFLKEFREFEKNGGLPNLSIVYLPQDHLGGGVTSNAHMADNDLALGRLVQAVSGSEYWKNTVIFVNEDDPQNGYDHVDGHRSLCLVISAYSRPGINSSFYNQTSALRTMLHILGLPPLNQQDASMPLMRDCFTDTADLTPFVALPANVELNETPQPPENQSAAERRWRQILATVPIQRTGMKTEQDEDNLNRFVWHETRGWQTAYPQQWAGPHGRGLKSLGLVIDNSSDEDATDEPSGKSNQPQGRANDD